MARTFAFTLKRPHEHLGLPMPVGRRLFEMSRETWLACMGTILLSLMGLYMYQVNTVANKSFRLRALEKRSERLQENISSLENRMEEKQSIRALEEQMSGLGYVPVARVEFLDRDGASSVAVAK